jgi:hypothetical protein
MGALPTAMLAGADVIAAALATGAAVSDVFAFGLGPFAAPADDVQSWMLADPVRQIRLRLHDTGRQRSLRLDQQMFLPTRIRGREGTDKDDKIDEIHAFS